MDQYKVSSPSSLGSLLLVRLEKQRYWVEDNWFCRYVKVQPPGETTVLTFPCYRWLVGDVKMEIREGTGTKESGDKPSQAFVVIKATPDQFLSRKIHLLVFLCLVASLTLTSVTRMLGRSGKKIKWREKESQGEV